MIVFGEDIVEKIVYRNLKEEIRGIDDVYGKRGLVARDLGRQIFEKYNYYPTIDDFDFVVFEDGLRSVSEERDDGINDIIFYNDVPTEDILNIKQFNCLNTYKDYVIDYRSNNNRYLDSIYVKLMSVKFFETYENDKVFRRIKNVRSYRKKAKEKGQDLFRKNSIEEQYGNKFILGGRNVTDYYFFVQYTERNIMKSTLKTAHLVPAEPLKHQVVGILNNILKNEGDEYLITPGKDGLFLNHKIVKALQIFQEENGETSDNEIELFKFSRGEISLRIPDKLLKHYIRFNEFGEIIS